VRALKSLLSLTIVTAALVSTGCSVPAISVPARAEARAPDLAPRTLVAQQAASGAPAGATAYTVLYRSTGTAGEPILVSGMIFVRAGTVPQEGRPVIA
jgi:hypothetical protein